MNTWIILLIAVIGEVVATTSLKLSEGFTKLVPSVVVVVGYAIAFYCLSITLKSIPLGIAYAVWSGLGIVTVSILGWLVFGQKLDIWALLGMFLIICGVLILNLLSKTAAH
ncbi:QacE family quaternary ammonium compound efflux SMR transporter [Atlantibacter hermannii]|uniref:DMT family transporter n=1 Tax=Enterobacterales TaxID=91347 RepID=UPI0013769A70|nr:MULTISPECIES: SMR family transporter [Enterobacteriaceae]EFF5984191.1 QacE family quaternary ammonium compound efflux SMR transporter [Escherichia coli]EIF0093430.1 QacE family quaternary ammonium compound efflux SMR transporter [Salmonella enterica]EFF5986586.1 QacE family quaternary ammonium compound efflux SMR transporter [Escherichia coli]MBK1548366.1 QacE family quaternary ammonium compound efflux SMR transporter [Enterobacter hormaechei]NBC97877.1 QacE family quaternary ammonium compo